MKFSLEELAVISVLVMFVVFSKILHIHKNHLENLDRRLDHLETLSEEITTDGQTFN